MGRTGLNTNYFLIFEEILFEGVKGIRILGIFLLFLLFGLHQLWAQQSLIGNRQTGQYNANKNRQTNEREYALIKPVLHFTEDDGLADNRVLDVVLDTKGILWVATENGISKFDGTEFINLSKSHGLPSQKVGALAMGGNGEIYAGCSNGGLVVFRNDSIVHTIPGSEKMVFRELYFSSFYKMLIVGTENGLFVLERNRLLPVEYHKDTTDRSVILSIAAEGADIYFTVLKGKTEGVYRLNLNSRFPEKATATRIHDMSKFACAMMDGYLYAGEYHKILKFATKQGSADRGKRTVADKMDSISLIWRLTPWKDGLLWVGGLGDQRFVGGIWLFDTKSRKLLPSGLPQNNETVNAIFYDTVHNVTWFGKDDGLVAFRESPFEYIDFKGKETILDIGQIGDSLLLLTPESILLWNYRGSEGSGLYGFNRVAPANDRMRHGYSGLMKAILPVQKIMAAILKEWEKGMATINGFRYFFDISFSLEPDSFISGSNNLYVQSGKGAISVPDLRNYFPMGIGNLVIMPNGHALSAEKYCPLLFRESVSDPTNYRVMEDSSMTTWGNFKIRELNGVIYSASSINGLLMVSDGRSFRLNEQNSVLSNSLIDIEPDSNGEMWCLTHDNMLHAVAFRGKQPVITRSIALERCGMVGNSARWLKFAEDWLFIATNEGLNAMTTRSLGSPGPQFSHFWNRQNGYNYLTAASPLLTAEGNIVLHTENEIVVVHTGAISAQPVTILIQQLVINEQPSGIESLTQQHLPYSTKQISFLFKGLKYPSARNIRYRYKINDDPWISGNHVSLQSLRPGNYKLQLEINDPESKQVVTQELAFSIADPFWLSWWFLLLVLLLIVGASYAVFRLRLSVHKKRHDEKTALLVENATLHLRSLQIQMNPHFIFNALSSVQYSILQNDSKASLYYLSNISSVIRTSLANASKTRIPLDEEIEFLQKYIRIELSRFNEKLNITLINHCTGRHLNIPPMLVQPIIENAIKHGITPGEGGGNITITFSQTPDTLIITVKDDGIGRDASRKLQSLRTDHFGLEITEKRLHLLNQQHKTTLNRLEIIDHRSNGLPTGTEVVLTLALE